MTTTDLIPVTTGAISTHLSDRRRRAREAGERAEAEQRRPATKSAYAMWQSKWMSWCDAESVAHLPPGSAPAPHDYTDAETYREALAAHAVAADEWYATVYDWLSDLRLRGYALASLQLARAALSAMVAEAGLAVDMAHPRIRGMLAGMRQTRHDGPAADLDDDGRPDQRGERGQATALQARDVLDMDAMGIFAMGELADLRDRALLYSGVATARRGPSELLMLDWMRHGDGAGWIDASGERWVITLLRSKANKGGERETYYLERGPVTDAVLAWVRAAGIATGTPLWRPLARGGVRALDRRLSGRALSDVIKRRVRPWLESRQGLHGADLEAAVSGYRTHSLRSGGITTLAAAGASIPQMREVSGHSTGSASILIGYAQTRGEGAKAMREAWETVKWER